MLERQIHLPRKLAPAVALVAYSLLSGTAWAVDTDQDGIDDATDNCTLVANSDQRDTNADRFGNACDGDLNQDGLVNSIDLGLFKQAFGKSTNLDADFNGDGTVNSLDLGKFKTLFGKPPGPAAAANTGISDVAAARFLAQATFGPTLADIKQLQTLGSMNAWLDGQFTRSASLLLPAARSLYDQNRAACLQTEPPSNCPEDRALIKDTYDDQFRFAWWNHVIDGSDQLRQRVAFALSQILVVGDYPEPVAGSKFGLSDYYDTLARNAFGNYRTLLEAVTLHPVMGLYLSMAKNEKADPDRNIRPDENYARELMQLFTIGVHELDSSGRAILDGAGQPKPTYDQATVENFARVFTGWNLDGIDWYDWFGNGDRTKPMVAVEQYHDRDGKTLLRGTVLAPGQNARADLQAALDNVFNHPNVGPFVSRQLIQRLVTSNPTPAYVGRVAAVFNNNGLGVRGDLKAVVKAILLDAEARTAPAGATGYGKLREPLLRVSHLFRAFHASRIAGKEWGIAPSVPVYRSPGVWSGLRYFEEDIGQNILRSPSVFNFYQPTHSPAGVLRDAGLVAPEFQIATENMVMGMTNTLNFHIQYAETGGDWTYLDLSAENTLMAAGPDKLLDHLNVVLMAGSMSDAVRSAIRNHLVSSPFPAGVEGHKAKVRDAISLLVNSPEYMIQK